MSGVLGKTMKINKHNILRCRLPPAPPHDRRYFPEPPAAISYVLSGSAGSQEYYDTVERLRLCLTDRKLLETSMGDEKKKTRDTHAHHTDCSNGWGISLQKPMTNFKHQLPPGKEDIDHFGIAASLTSLRDFITFIQYACVCDCACVCGHVCV